MDAGTGAGRPVQMVETLDSLEVSFAFGINHEVSDQVTGLDDATHVVAVVGNRVAMVNTEQQDYQPHELSNDTRTATAEPVRFLPHLPHVQRITALTMDERRRTLAVCVEARVHRTSEDGAAAVDCQRR